MARPLIVKITCGAEAAERANQAWTVASMGLAAGADVTVWLTGEAVWFAVAGKQPDLALPHAADIVDLVEVVRGGGTIHVCSQCAARRDLTVHISSTLLSPASLSAPRPPPRDPRSGDTLVAGASDTSRSLHSHPLATTALGEVK